MSMYPGGENPVLTFQVKPHPEGPEQIKSPQKATLRSECFANRALSAIIRTQLQATCRQQEI